MSGLWRFVALWGIGAVAMGSLARPSGAEVTPARGAVDPRVRTAPYQADQVYRVQGAVGIATDIELQPGERFVGLAGGDLGGISVSVHGSHVFLKPKAARVETNLTLLTDRRVYRFDYEVESARTVRGSTGRADGNQVVYALQFTYPPVVVPGPASRVPAAGVRPGASAPPPKPPPRVINRRYAFCGSKELAPVRASDDGVQTRLEFGARQELPAIFVRNADGSEGLVNFTVEPDAVIVHRVAERLILRRGRLVGCVWNRAYRGAGERLPTGTVVPGVTRALKAVRP